MERKLLLVGRSVYIHEIFHMSQRPKNTQTGSSALEYPSKENVLRMVSVSLSCVPAV